LWGKVFWQRYRRRQEAEICRRLAIKQIYARTSPSKMSALQKPQDGKRLGRGVLRLYKKIPCIKLAGEKAILKDEQRLTVTLNALASK
jgi:hypothetical protein